jgi:tetratricopeptide (TPR) repeat protein
LRRWRSARSRRRAASYRAFAAEAKELLGDFEGAERDLAAKFEWFRDKRGGLPYGIAVEAAAELALLLCRQGRFEEADELMAYARAVTVPPFFRKNTVCLLAATARLAAGRGDVAEAKGLALRAVRIGDESDYLSVRGRLWEELAEVLLATDEAAAAGEALATAARLHEAKGYIAAVRRLRRS